MFVRAVTTQIKPDCYCSRGVEVVQHSRLSGCALRWQ